MGQWFLRPLHRCGRTTTIAHNSSTAKAPRGCRVRARNLGIKPSKIAQFRACIIYELFRELRWLDIHQISRDITSHGSPAYSVSLKQRHSHKNQLIYETRVDLI